jgi:hypothetical protein
MVLSDMHLDVEKIVKSPPQYEESFFRQISK